MLNIFNIIQIDGERHIWVLNLIQWIKKIKINLS